MVMSMKKRERQRTKERKIVGGKNRGIKDTERFMVDLV